uniref:DNA polymerase alpha/delta/epsilon subunit B domain-containing protein n=1 Tax=Romanomermis culicivorax TaxID=13658 RepID=A0A915HMT2_ROMCU
MRARSMRNFARSHRSTSVKVDLMPGEHDPTNKMLPQQPFHKCMLPKSLEYESVNNVTNPFLAEICGTLFLGTSGQNIDDIYRFCDEENRLKIASWILKWRHLAPSSPDTLDCYPFTDNDPFYIEERPDVFFIGNQPEFGCQRFEDDQKRPMVILTLPNFAETGYCALINLKDLKVEPLRFGPLLKAPANDTGNENIEKVISDIP